MLWLVTFTPEKWHYSKLQKRSAFTNKKIKQSQGNAYYDKHFKQGATIVPRNFYFVEITQNFTGELTDRYLQVQTSKESIAEAKMPWKNIHLSGTIHSSFLFYTALAKNIMPFGLIAPPIVLLPIKINEDNKTCLCNSDTILKQGHIETADWFKKVENNWDKNKTETSKNMSSNDRLNFQHGLTDQDLNEKYLVLYTASAKNANATIVRRSDFKSHFIVESKAYVLYTNNLAEAHYLTCCLNSNYANELVKDFQSRGLFGPRDMHKKILGVPFPRYNPKDEMHNKLTELGIACSKKAKVFIANEINLNKYNIGLVRSAFLKVIKSDTNCI